MIFYCRSQQENYTLMWSLLEMGTNTDIYYVDMHYLYIIDIK